MQRAKSNLRVEVELPVQPDDISFRMDVPLKGEELEEFAAAFAEAYGEYKVRKTREVLEQAFEDAEIDVRCDMPPSGQMVPSEVRVSAWSDAWGDDRRVQNEERTALEGEIEEMVEGGMGYAWEETTGEGASQAWFDDVERRSPKLGQRGRRRA